MANSGLKVASVQMRVVDGEPQANQKRLAEILDAQEACDLYLAPELFTSGYLHSRWDSIASQQTPETLNWLAGEAKRRNAWMGASVVAKDSDGAMVNRFVLYDRSGNLKSTYDKAHLFLPLKEDVYLKAGSQIPSIVDLEGFKASMAICFDLRFPEMFRKLTLMGANLFLVVSEWPHPRSRVLRTLSEARAMENQAAVVLSNRFGLDSLGNDFCGGSAIFGPAGLIAEAEPNEGMVVSELSLEALLQVRESFPVMSQRRCGIDYE